MQFEIPFNFAGNFYPMIQFLGQVFLISCVYMHNKTTVSSMLYESKLLSLAMLDTWPWVNWKEM
jgi:hypothetical protein